jgi:predicted transcriptional regulator
MENSTTEITVSRQKPKGIKTADVKRLKRTGMSVPEISDKLGVSHQTVRYHLAKKRADVGVKRNINPTPVDNNTGFEAELFGTLIKLDKTPSSIERVGNRIVIK